MGSLSCGRNCYGCDPTTCTEATFTVVSSTPTCRPPTERENQDAQRISGPSAQVRKALRKLRKKKRKARRRNVARV